VSTLRPPCPPATRPGAAKTARRGPSRHGLKLLPPLLAALGAWPSVDAPTWTFAGKASGGQLSDAVNWDVGLPLGAADTALVNGSFTSALTLPEPAPWALLLAGGAGRAAPPPARLTAPRRPLPARPARPA